MQLILFIQVARQMMKYCRYPSTRQYNVVAAKLIEAYEMLKDCEGTGSVSILNLHSTNNNYNICNITDVLVRFVDNSILQHERPNYLLWVYKYLIPNPPSTSKRNLIIIQYPWICQLPQQIIMKQFLSGTKLR